MRMVFCLITEYKPVAELIDDDGLGAIHLIGEELLRQVVEYELLDGTLHRTCTKVWVITLFCQIVDGLRCALELDALWLQHIRYLLHL